MRAYLLAVAFCIALLGFACKGKGAELPQVSLRPPQSTLEDYHGGNCATYAEAYLRAVREDKPLVLWIGSGDVQCPACVKTLGEEAVHFAAPQCPDVPNLPPRALVVLMPNAGGLTQAATITRWVTGDRVWGHVPSIRRAVDAWRTRRATTPSGWSTGLMDGYNPFVPPAPVNRPQAMPMTMPMMPSMRMGRSGGG